MRQNTFATISNMRIRRFGKKGFEWSKNYASSVGWSNHNRIKPTMKRLEWLYKQSLSKHGFEALFLFGSMSWGRFHAVQDDLNHTSDIDFLVLVDSLLDTQLIDKLKTLSLNASSVFADIFSNEKASIASAHVVAFESELAEENFKLSCTLIERDVFLRLLDGSEGTIVAIRNKPIPVDSEIRRFSCSGELYRPVLTYNISNNIQRAVSTLFQPKEGVGLPAYLELIMPNMEYFGNLPNELEYALKNFGCLLGNKLRQHPHYRPFSHYRYSRMPRVLQFRFEEIMMSGPCKLG